MRYREVCCFFVYIVHQETTNPMAEIVKNNKRTVNGWALFDWANSAYALVIATAIFPTYFTSVTPDEVSFAGYTFSNSSLYAFAVSAAYIIIAALSPLLSGIADYSGRKKYFLKIFTLVGSLSCISLFWFSDASMVWFGTVAFMLSTIGFAGGIVFYDAYLPQIVTEDRYDKTSARGFAYGYVGSVILLIAILVLIQRPHWFGLEGAGIASRIGFVMVGLWWLGFAQISFRRLPPDNRQAAPNALSRGYKEIRQVFLTLQCQPDLKRFLGAFFCYSAGVQTVVYVATVFAEEILGFETGELIIIVLLIQLVAIVGAYFFAWLCTKQGNRFSIIVMLCIWLVVCGIAYFAQTKMTFYGMAALTGLVVGGVQSVSRSSYSKMLPSTVRDVTSYFSFYDVLYKSSIVSGTLLFGIVDNITGDMRNSVLVLASFFVIGIVLISRTNIENPRTLHRPDSLGLE